MTPSQDTKASKTIQTKLHKAKELERQLANIPLSGRTTEFEAKASQIRLELCENLSDILLCDPTVATQYDVAAKLWRGCFYDRIVELRGRISRASRSKSMDKGEKKKILMGLEKTLQQFLSEAIKLYVYLIGKYESMLVPQSTQSQSQLSYQSQESRSHDKRNKKSSNGALLLSPPSSDDSTHFVVPQGVIPTLYRILIHQGDLYRYDGDFTMAESSYSKASKLAPGKGNPYNQLAVVSQLKDVSCPLSCVALYWYARSLLAVDEQMDTSRLNLVRLLASNKKWLEEHGEQSAPAELPEGASRKAVSEHMRAVKSAASRRFLAHFVGLHGDLFHGVAQDESMDESTSAAIVTPDEISEKMSDLLESFNTLLSGSAFGDSLLCKMVAINAFSISTAGNQGHASFQKDKIGITQTSRCFSWIFLLQFGSALATRVKQTLQKITETRTLSMVRSLVPLLLLCDYVSSKSDMVDKLERVLSDTTSSAFAKEVIRAFWASIVDVANAIKNVESTIKVNYQTLFPSQKAELPSDYKSFIGYLPFKTFIDDTLSDAAARKHGLSAESSDDGSHSTKVKSSKFDGYVRTEDAVSALNLYDTQASQDDSTAGKKDEKSADREAALRFGGFIGFVDQMVHQFCPDDGSNREYHLVYDDTRTADPYSFAVDSDDDEDEAPVAMDTDDNEAMDMDITEKEVTREEKMMTPQELLRAGEALDENMKESVVDRNTEDDVVVFKAPASGGGPALLVPGNFLMGLQESKVDSSVKEDTEKESSFIAGLGTDKANGGATEMMTSDLVDPALLLGKEKPASVSVTQPQISAPPGIKPPPGLMPPPGLSAEPTVPLPFLAVPAVPGNDTLLNGNPPLPFSLPPPSHPPGFFAPGPPAPVQNQDDHMPPPPPDFGLRSMTTVNPFASLDSQVIGNSDLAPLGYGTGYMPQGVGPPSSSRLFSFSDAGFLTSSNNDDDQQNVGPPGFFGNHDAMTNTNSKVQTYSDTFAMDHTNDIGSQDWLLGIIPGASGIADDLSFLPPLQDEKKNPEGTTNGASSGTTSNLFDTRNPFMR